MLAIRIVIASLRALFRRDTTTDEICGELHFPLDMRADEYARHAALRRFGMSR